MSKLLAEDRRPPLPPGVGTYLVALEDDRIHVPPVAAAYRAVYTMKFAGMFFVLLAFQKKSKKGIATPKADMHLIKQRLKLAAEQFKRLLRD